MQWDGIKVATSKSWSSATTKSSAHYHVMVGRVMCVYVCPFTWRSILYTEGMMVKLQDANEFLSGKYKFSVLFRRTQKDAQHRRASLANRGKHQQDYDHVGHVCCCCSVFSLGPIFVSFGQDTFQVALVNKSIGNYFYYVCFDQKRI